ncbi:hypothetical protein J0895_21500 [Phormidium pseudopriestleyi FRX01]|uniref:Uncharacterized protein n=1 Tax=Phormidium pseudopriestleyi FRX01 TaxID=1759528 RepID=A0ABS3FWY2_9CYAN|nr:hypothetical protein [Phormidium pseudopriestleyi]MBO0351610.1 hypothetical protein [Phormidium pseudopriestleyi FRX01]
MTFPEGKIVTAHQEPDMRLNELLPAIHQLNPTDKQKLFELLDRELHPTPPTPAPELQPENFQNEGQWLIAVFERYFSQIEPNEIPIAPREPIRVDETLFGEL